MAKLAFSIPGFPVAWQRAGQSRATGATFTNPKSRSYKALVAMTAENARLAAAGTTMPFLDGPLALRVDVYRPRPASWPKRRQSERYDVRRPDVDNTLKQIADALNGIVYRDDAQIAIATVTKRFDDRARVDVTVTELT